MLFPCLKSSSGFLSYLEEIPNSLFWLKKSCMSWPLAVSLTTFYTALHLSYYAVATLNLCLVPDQYRLLSLLSLLHCSSFWFSLVFWSLVLGVSSPLRGLASPSFSVIFHHILVCHLGIYYFDTFLSGFMCLIPYTRELAPWQQEPYLSCSPVSPVLDTLAGTDGFPVCMEWVTVCDLYGE